MTLVYVQNNSGSYSQEGARSREGQLLLSGVSGTFSIQSRGSGSKQLKSGLGANAEAVQWPPFHFFFLPSLIVSGSRSQHEDAQSVDSCLYHINKLSGATTIFKTWLDCLTS